MPTHQPMPQQKPAPRAALFWYPLDVPTPRHHHLQRIDDERSRTHAWRAQVQRRHRVMIEHFSDGVYGGKQEALKAARRWRETMLTELHNRRYELWRRNCKRRNNTSGVVGVGRYVSRERNGRAVIERISWQAFWDGSDGRRHGRKFSVDKYGERRARELACQTRRAALRALAKRSL